MTLQESTRLAQVRIDNEVFYQISNVDAMRPFFMSILSNSNHWLFVGSNGGISAGRKDSESALFPYYTDDKIIESSEQTGSKTILRVLKEGKTFLWEPFSIRYASLYDLQRNLYKNASGNKILFEEINRDLELTFQYQWSTSDAYGFVKTSRLIQDGERETNLSVLDGIQNILPYGVGSALQNRTSNLVDAYKRNELDAESGVGIFALSAMIVDKPEPSEALKATMVWSIGLENSYRLLSSSQLESFRAGRKLWQETDIKAEKGAYFTVADILLEPKSKKEWMLIADVNQTASQIIAITKAIKTDKHLVFRVKEDVELGTKQLIQLTAATDGLQLTADGLKDTRHYFNSLFNIMRGGMFDNHYQIERNDFSQYLSKANQEVFQRHQQNLTELPHLFQLTVLKDYANQSGDNDLRRLCIEYLPLKFSRRHGDPSRPWNQFSINTRNESDGSKVLYYAGNWRDIFQNWEALAHSYPSFVEGMIFKFLNASTFDGYNPYRVTKNGIDWEKIEPDDPWSYIGYWGDHQIIYLLKFLEFSECHAPGKLASYFNDPVFVYANVPYKIKAYEDILRNPKDTILFDHKLDQAIQKRWAVLGADSVLLQNKNGDIHHVNFIEKILATVLAKISNFIPEGGIWMNTQRPEWNDANNALVGNGVSVVTLFYLRRFLKFFQSILEKSDSKEVAISEELIHFFTSCWKVLEDHKDVLAGSISNRDRKTILDGLGSAASTYRELIYKYAFSDQRTSLPLKDVIAFSGLCVQYLEHTIRASKRSDNLYHSYNLMTIEGTDEISISYLSEMLEGQVAALSSGYLTSPEVLATLDSLKASTLFREDQSSYLLYPNKNIPGFLKKNNIPQLDATKSHLLIRLIKEGNTHIVIQDVHGGIHFNGNFKNASDLQKALSQIEATTSDKEEVLRIFESVFNHKAFTGRSGTFFGYEGLGSIYWHMVSKLQLAVQECCLRAIREKESEMLISKLLTHYYETSEGIGVHKSPKLYGAFPTDPYSHTPANKGAQQPGMTGQVKEDIISRLGELGVFVKKGCLYFDPCMLRKSEFLTRKQTFRYIDVHGHETELRLEEKSLAFTYCQVPIVYKIADENAIEIVMTQGVTSFDQQTLDATTSQKIFDRNGEIIRIVVMLKQEKLR